MSRAPARHRLTPAQRRGRTREAASPDSDEDHRDHAMDSSPCPAATLRSVPPESREWTARIPVLRTDMTLTVDLHQHIIPDFYWQASNEDGNAAGGINPPRWTLEGAIAYLDEAGIDVAVPSISTPRVQFGDGAAA